MIYSTRLFADAYPQPLGSAQGKFRRIEQRSRNTDVGAVPCIGFALPKAKKLVLSVVEGTLWVSDCVSSVR